MGLGVVVGGIQRRLIGPRKELIIGIVLNRKFSAEKNWGILFF